jgi:3-hydroxybutyryl-CoA dehydrogenase
MELRQVREIAVIGAGTMGAGIAQACAAAGFQVAMRDIEQRFVEGGFRRIREPLAKRVEKGKMTAAEVDSILSRIRGVVDLKEAVTGAQIVIDLREDGHQEEPVRGAGPVVPSRGRLRVEHVLS